MKYKVPFVNYPKQYQELKPELDQVWERIMSTGQFILRDDVEQFEQKIQDYLGVEHCISCANGTDALNMCCEVLGLGKGDEVITVGHTFLATVGAIVKCEATPVLIDVGNDYNMDVSQIEPAITKNTKAIIPVHLNGRSCEMDKVMRLCKRYGLNCIEDNAQSLGAKYKGKFTGTFGVLSILSFYPAKILGCPGDGGAICTNDGDLAYKLRAMRDNGRVKGLDEVLFFGYNSRLDNLHAAILNIKIERLKGYIYKRKELAFRYFERLTNSSVTIDIKLPYMDYDDSPCNDVWQNFVISFDYRDKLKLHLDRAGIETLISWPIPMHKQPYLFLNKYKLPMTEYLSKSVLSLPLYPEMGIKDVDYVCSKIKDFNDKVV